MMWCVSAGLYSNPPNCPSKSFHQTSTFCESRSALGGGNFIFFYVLALQVVFCDFSSGLPNTVFGISSCAPLPSIYYLWSPHPLPGNRENCLFVFLLQILGAHYPHRRWNPVSDLWLSFICLLVSAFFPCYSWTMPLGGKRQTFWKNISPAYQFFFSFFQIVLLVSYLRILCLTHGHKDFLLCFLLKVLHFLFRSVWCFVHFTQPGLTWEEFSEGLTTLGWHLGITVGGCLNYINWVGSGHPLWAPYPGP